MKEFLSLRSLIMLRVEVVRIRVGLLELVIGEPPVRIFAIDIWIFIDELFFKILTPF